MNPNNLTSRCMNFVLNLSILSSFNSLFSLVISLLRLHYKDELKNRQKYISPYSMYSYLYPEENKSFCFNYDTVEELVYQLVPRLINAYD